jgi:ABC-type oligopeptide transport system ATPase subunit
MYFSIPQKGLLHAVDDVSFDVYPGETMGLVGESGCGKSTVGNVIMRLLHKTDGQILYQGKNIFTEWPDKLEISKKMQIIFQDPYSSLNPRKTIDKSSASRISSINTATKKRYQKRSTSFATLLNCRTTF